MNRRSIHLHIDELVLDGFAPADRHRIADAVEYALASWFAGQQGQLEPGAPLRLDAIDAGAFAVTSRGATQVGQQIARSVGTALAGAMRSPPARMAKGGSP